MMVYDPITPEPLPEGTVVSPLRAPQPRHPDQVPIWPGPIETTWGPLTMHLTIALHRLPRQKCVICKKRRVGFRIGLGDAVTGPAMCAKCAGIR